MESTKEFLSFLLNRFKIEKEKFDLSGVYAYTQRLLAYNSNKIEGSTLPKSRRLLCLIMVFYRNPMIITEQKM